MKRIWILFLVIALAVSVIACGKDTKEPATTEGPIYVESDPTAQLGNPWTDYSVLDEACAAADIQLIPPEMIFGYDEIVYRAMGQEVVEIQYQSADAETITLRKGATEADISGDHIVYDYAAETTVENLAVTIKGQDAADLFSASWVQDGHFYSLVSTIVMPSDAMLSLVAEVIQMNAI